MTDKYQALRDGMPELQREAARKGGYNPRAQLIIDLLAERDALQAECEKLREKVGLIICDECHAKCSEPYTGLFDSQRPDEEPCIMCECRSLRMQLASRGGVPEPVVTDEMIEALQHIEETATRQMLIARIPECGEFAAIAQDAGWLLDALKAAKEAETMRKQMES